MAKRVSDKTCSQEFVRVSEPKAPTNIFNKLCAFTLAEVLITLAIIGVVAALTIPTVVKNYQKQQTVVKLKKVYSQLNSAVQMASVEYGNPSLWNFCEFPQTSVGRKQFYEKYFKQYLKVIKEYPTNTNLVEQYKWLNGNKITGGYLPAPANYDFVLNDGTFIALESCSGSTQLQNVIFHVDLNGVDNPPNTAGKDYFYFELHKDYKGKVLPSGYSKSDINNNCKKGAIGQRCTAKIMRDNWEIKYDW